MNKEGKNTRNDQVSDEVIKEQQNINIETVAKVEANNSYIAQTEEDLSNENTIQTEEDLSNEHTIQTEEDLSNEHITQTKKDLSNERIAQLETKLAISQRELRDLQLRTQAKIENINRRVEIDIEKAHKFALEKFINELLPVIDSLERALEVTDKTNLELSSMIEGIELTLKSFLNVVRKFGVEVISDTNVPFNPEVHQAMSMVESEDIAPNHVLIVMQRGYTLNGRLLRPAMVAVAKTKN